MYITNGIVFGGTPEHFDILVISWQFEHFWVNKWQGIYNSQNYKIVIEWRQIISFDFHHIHVPKLSIGFKSLCKSHL